MYFELFAKHKYAQNTEAASIKAGSLKGGLYLVVGSVRMRVWFDAFVKSSLNIHIL